MSDSVKSFYDRLKTIEDIEKLCLQEEPESLTLEYKEAFVDWKGEGKEIAKDVSAMANSEGGVIIYGVKTGKKNDKTIPVEITNLHKANTHERFVQIVNSNIRNEILGWDCKPFSKDGKSVLVVMIPKSLHTPHQSLPEARYYFRSGVENMRMEHHLVELHFGRRLGPQLRAYAKFIRDHKDPSSLDGYTEWFTIHMSVKNEGQRSAKNISGTVILPQIDMVRMQQDRSHLKDVSMFNPGFDEPIFSFDIRKVIHPGQLFTFTQMKVCFSKAWISVMEVIPLFRWAIYADDMERKEDKFYVTCDPFLLGDIQASIVTMGKPDV